LTLDENGNVAAAWTPDSRAVLFASNRDENWKLFRQAIDQATPEVVADVQAVTGENNVWIVENY
jgi:Tol biopolymer transport system component